MFDFTFAQTLVENLVYSPTDFGCKGDDSAKYTHTTEVYFGHLLYHVKKIKFRGVQSGNFPPLQGKF